jgi:hypothetical protein
MDKRNNLSEMKTKFRLLPTDLKWLFWFSVSMFFTCTLSMIFAHEQLYEKIIPYTGWCPQNMYLFLAFFVGLAKTQSSLLNFVRIRYKIVLLLGIYLVLGIYDWFDKTPEYYTHTNPYLRYEPLRPIYAIFLPLFWILIIGWPLMKNFFRKKSKALV